MEKYNKYILILIAVIVIGMSIGYSALNSNLKISGEVNYRPQEDVRITNFTTDNKPNEMTIQYSDYSKYEVKLGYTTSGACNITYTVEVSNFSGVNIGILEIGGLDNNVIVQSDIIGKKLVGPADTQTFTITFNSTIAETKTYLLTFDFEQVFTITYNGFSNTENYKKEILEGEDYTQNFGSNAPTKLEITMGGVAIENYTYSNGTLTILNVNGNIEINVPNACEFPSYTDSSGANAPILNGDMIPVVYSEKCQSWIKQDLNKSYDYSKQIWANAVTVVEDSKREKSLGLEAKNLINISSIAYKSTNQGQDRTTSNLTLTFKTGATGGTLLFYYSVSSVDGYLCIDINGNTIVEDLSGEYNGSYNKELSPNTKYTIKVDYYEYASNEGDGTAYISNLVVPNDLAEPLTVVSTGKYPWTQYEVPNSRYVLFLDYELDIDKEIFALKGVERHSFSSSDVGKYMCTDGVSATCSELYKITKVEDNIIKEVEKYTIEQFKARENYVNAPVGTEIPMSYINTMWVWIPRYSYTIKSEDEGNYFGKASLGNDSPTKKLPGEIDVKFIKNETDKGIAQYMGDNVNGWRTNEAFNFGGEKKTGMWVGKFETSGRLKRTCVDETCDVSNVTIKPSVTSLSTQLVSSFFFMSRSMQVSYADTYGFNKNSGDLHMMKNDEWGAVAYLSQSKYGKYGNTDYIGENKEIYISNSFRKTGNSGGSPNASEDDEDYEYNDMTNLGTGKGQAGPGASTTGNIYGIYDMSGGNYEYVMGVLEYDAQGVDTHNGQIATGGSEFKGLDYYGSATGSYDLPNEKYYNKYKSASPTSHDFTTAKPELACNGEVCYGHALSETSSWYSDGANFISYDYPWLLRGNYYMDTTIAGIFSIYDYMGDSTDENSCRLTFTP